MMTRSEGASQSAYFIDLLRCSKYRLTTKLVVTFLDNILVDEIDTLTEQLLQIFNCIQIVEIAQWFCPLDVEQIHIALSIEV